MSYCFAHRPNTKALMELWALLKPFKDVAEKMSTDKSLSIFLLRHLLNQLLENVNTHNTLQTKALIYPDLSRSNVRRQLKLIYLCFSWVIASLSFWLVSLLVNACTGCMYNLFCNWSSLCCTRVIVTYTTFCSLFLWHRWLLFTWLSATVLMVIILRRQQHGVST